MKKIKNGSPRGGVSFFRPIFITILPITCKTKNNNPCSAMNPKIYRNSVLPISFISKYMSYQHMLLDGSKIRPHLGCNSRVGVSI